MAANSRLFSTKPILEAVPYHHIYKIVNQNPKLPLQYSAMAALGLKFVFGYYNTANIDSDVY